MTGFTSEEVFLSNLSKNSFLQFWSWPNLFRDQGDCIRNGDGKEICDLVVIFGSDVILFSDKKVAFSANKEVKTAWSRWSRKAIGNAVRQIKGARRWFEQYPERIFVDNRCKHKIPVAIPDKSTIRFHNIVVCHGVEDILSTVNRESSFAFDNAIRGEAHWNQDVSTPFCVGQIFEGDFVHIFNESTIELVLNVFDTTKDFLHYLGQRKELLSSEKHIRLFSESDIIQLYYENFDEEKRERTVWPKELVEASSALIDMGGIQRLFSNEFFLAKRQEERVSYFWDDLIESFSFHVLNGTAEHRNWDNPKEAEPSLRFLASTSRFERRILAASFIEFYEKALPDQRGTRLCPDPANSENAYVFCLVPMNNSFSSDEHYREVRRAMIHDYCAINKFLDRSIKSVFGIACKTRDGKQRLSPKSFFSQGQDFVYLHGEDWGEDDFLEAEETYKEYVSQGFFAERIMELKSINEFPAGITGHSKFRAKGKVRNEPCACGSGKKTKKCCGRP